MMLDGMVDRKELLDIWYSGYKKPDVGAIVPQFVSRSQES
jgi:hypothetical protein